MTNGLEDQKKIKVLQINAGSIYFGGVSAFLYNVFKYIDKEQVIFDFLSPDKTTYGIVEDELKEYGCNIVELGILGGGKKHIKLYVGLKKYLREHKYDIIHINSGGPIFNYIVMMAAWKANIQNIIVHSHNDDSHESWVKNMVFNYIRPQFEKKAKVLFACSNNAGKFMFGKSKYTVIKNGINLERFKFDIEKRKELRNNENIKEEQKVIGFCGRLTYQKNPLFVLEIFKEISLKMANSVFWMIGEGDLLGEVKNKIDSLGLSESVRLYGVRSDVNVLMQGMDAILMPSIYEGLGIVAIEAQAAGLPIVASDRIPQETNVSSHIIYKSLDDSSEDWATATIEHIKNNCRDRSVITSQLQEYDINTVSSKILNIYKGMVEF